MKRTTLTTALAALILVAVAIPASATTDDSLTVDGTTYSPTHLSGPTVHYETPDVNPTVAFTLGSHPHAWNGVNGAEWLPCEFGIHWVDNANLLTISHCLDGETTTTTTSSTTTTTEPTTTTSSTTTTTTTTVPKVTTTTLGTTTTTDPTTTTTTDPTTTTTTDPTTTTTTDPTTTTTDPGPTTTVTPTTTPDELPLTGTNLGALALVGLAMLGLGTALLRKPKPE